MDKISLEKLLKEEGLDSIYTQGSFKQYIDGELLCKDGGIVNAINVFGYFKINETGEYKIFITDSERGIPYISSKYPSEEEACEALYQKISRLKRIHEKGLG